MRPSLCKRHGVKGSCKAVAQQTIHLQLLQGMSDVLNSHLAAHAVHVVKVNISAIKSLQRLQKLLPDAVKRCAIFHARRHELCGDN